MFKDTEIPEDHEQGKEDEPSLVKPSVDDKDAQRMVRTSFRPQIA